MKGKISPLEAWALSFGCSIGWGAFIMPGTTFLPQSGILGTIIGIAVGVCLMLLVGQNYHWMIVEHPNSGGAFSYTCHAFGYDHGFLCGWFLFLTYVALIWANTSAMILLARYIFGDVLQFGIHYRIAGFDVYLGEALLCTIIMGIATAACLFRKKIAYFIESIFAILLLGGIIVCFTGTTFAGAGHSVDVPMFAPDIAPNVQIMKIVAIVPWMFVGFESISHSAGEFDFSPKKAFRIMALAILASAVAYVLMLMCAVLNLPEGYNTWVEYIEDLGSFSGRAAVPTISAVERSLGKPGIVLVCCTMFSALFTSVIGNMIAASRMLFSFSEDHVIPKWFGNLNKDEVPNHAILFIFLISLFVPFLGRTAISWHVDVSNVGASVAYGYTSLCVWAYAKRTKNQKAKAFGIIGFAVSLLFVVLLLVPNNLTGNALEPESYLILTGWVVLGFALYRVIFKRDTMGRFGKTTIVWIVLLFLGLFTAVSWERRESIINTENVLKTIVHSHDSVVSELMDIGVGSDELLQHSVDYSTLLQNEIQGLQQETIQNSLLVLGIVVLSVSILISNYQILARKNLEQEKTIGVVQKKATTDVLTGVKNKTSYNERERLMNLQIKEGIRQDFAVVICDINNLKTVNDTLGHKAGDEFIQNGAKIICEVYAHSPVYRIGGDEFVVLLEGSDYENRDELMDALEDIMIRNRQEGKIVLAKGMSVYNSETDGFVNDVFERADRIMYANKKALKSETRV